MEITAPVAISSNVASMRRFSVKGSPTCTVGRLSSMVSSNSALAIVAPPTPSRPVLRPNRQQAFPRQRLQNKRFCLYLPNQQQRRLPNSCHCTRGENEPHHRQLEHQNSFRNRPHLRQHHVPIGVFWDAIFHRKTKHSSQRSGVRPW